MEKIFHQITFVLDTKFNIDHTSHYKGKTKKGTKYFGKRWKEIKERISPLKPSEQIDFELDIKGETYLENGVYSITALKYCQRYFVTMVALEEVNEMLNKYDNLKKKAYTDQLTGLLNRYGYYDYLQGFVKRAEMDDRGMFVLMIDIDNLKLINTDRGYKGGDIVISRIARIIARSIRKDDFAVRLGGDEFLVVVNDNNENDPNEQLERIAKRILHEVRKVKDELSSVSIGGHYIDPKGVTKLNKDENRKKNWQKIIDIVDQYSHSAKELGKNTIVTDGGVLI